MVVRALRHTGAVLLTVSATMPEAADLGYLLHKHPDRAQAFPVAVGTAHVLWPQVGPDRATAALLLEVDPIALVRNRAVRGADGFALAQYVNDRPYAASSLLAVALAAVFTTAMTGRCNARPELAATAIPLELGVPALRSRGGAELVSRLFEPLGWEVETTTSPLDPVSPQWGDSPYVDTTLRGTSTLAAALNQLYVLLPVLDDSKHYWVSDDEIDKLLRAGGQWLGAHPERELITNRYLRHQRPMVTAALARLAELDQTDPDELPDPATRPTPLAAVRTRAVLAELRTEGAQRVVDLGCGEGALLRELIADPSFTAVLGADVSPRALERAATRLNLERMPDTQRARLQLVQSSVTYSDERLAGYDAIVLMEVVEHVDAERLPALARSVFGHAHPTCVLVTTPNAEHNVRYPALDADAMRHHDHRFEFSRAEFRSWADDVASTYGYDVRFVGVGTDDDEVGPPTQMAVFGRSS